MYNEPTLSMPLVFILNHYISMPIFVFYYHDYVKCKVYQSIINRQICIAPVHNCAHAALIHMGLNVNPRYIYWVHMMYIAYLLIPTIRILFVVYYVIFLFFPALAVYVTHPRTAFHLEVTILSWCECGGGTFFQILFQGFGQTYPSNRISATLHLSREMGENIL